MPNPALYSEVGYEGQVSSMGGVKGATYKGRQVTSDSFTMSGATGVVLILPANPRRISALIQNVWDPAFHGSMVEISLGWVNTIPFRLTENGTFQIDGNFPWTGEVYGNLVTNNPVITVTEVTTT